MSLCRFARIFHDEVNSIFHSHSKQLQHYGSSILQHVMQADAKSAKELVLQFKASDPDPSWRAILIKCHSNEDYGVNTDGLTQKREWRSISALEYAVWVGDTFMVDMLIEHIPDSYKHLAFKQLQGVLNSGTKHGKYLAAYNPLIEAFQTYIDNFDNWNWETRDKHWFDVIVPSLASSPKNFLQEICGPTRFDSKASFNVPNNRSFILANGTSLLDAAKEAGFAPSYALNKQEQDRIISRITLRGKGVADAFLKALHRFREVRTQDLIDLISDLNPQKVTMKRSGCAS